MPKEYSSYRSSTATGAVPEEEGGDVERQVRRLLRAFSVSSPHIEACAAVTGDGFILASVLADEVDEDRFGAMCASLLSLSSRAAAEIGRGELRQIILDGAYGPMLLTRAGSLGVLAVATSPEANLGKVMLDTRRTARELAALAGS